jgi:hypothetical protein
MTEVLHEDSEQGIRALLEGRRIVTAETGDFGRSEKHGPTVSGRLTLDDGTRILVVPNEGGCACGGGDYMLDHLATVDNIITDVRLYHDPETEDNDYTQRYRIYVVADAVEINVLSVSGNDGSGYYGTGYELHVIPAGSSE